MSATFYDRTPMRSSATHVQIALTDTNRISGRFHPPSDDRPGRPPFYVVHMEADGVDLALHLTDPEMIVSLGAAMDAAVKHITEQENAA